MSIDPNSQRAVRIGLKTPPGAREKTYRLFVQEIPTQKKTQDVDINEKVKAGVTIAFRFSMPIFRQTAQTAGNICDRQNRYVRRQGKGDCQKHGECSC